MKTILVVDDDPVILALCGAIFASFPEEFTCITATDGQEAMEVLEQQPIDLMLTDLYMPVMDGFILLAQVSRSYPKMKVAVMSAYEQLGNIDLIKKAGALLFLSKPLDMEKLLVDVRRMLSESAQGYVRGITLFGLSQLLNMEKKTATVSVKSGERTGQLFFDRGDLIHAETQGEEGERAAYQIFGWDDWEIWLEQDCNTNKKTIQAPLQNVMLEAARRKDELNKPAEEIEEIEFDLSADSDASTKKENFSLSLSLHGAIAELPSELELTLQGEGTEQVELRFKTADTEVPSRKLKREQVESFLAALKQLVSD